MWFLNYVKRLKTQEYKGSNHNFKIQRLKCWVEQVSVIYEGTHSDFVKITK